MEKITRLLQRTVDGIDLYLSREIFNDITEIRKSTRIPASDNLQIFVDAQFSPYFNKDLMKLVDYNMAVRQLPDRKAALCAHGDFSHNKWVYYNNDAEHSVQSWINKLDGSYKLLLVNSCNSGGAAAYSKKSALLLPDRDFSAAELEDGLMRVELYIPNAGYIDSYCIDEYIADPKKMFSK